MGDQQLLKQSTMTMATPVSQLTLISSAGHILIEQFRELHISLGYIEAQCEMLYVSMEF